MVKPKAPKGGPKQRPDRGCVEDQRSGNDNSTTLEFHALVNSHMLRLVFDTAAVRKRK